VAKVDQGCNESLRRECLNADRYVLLRRPPEPYPFQELYFSPLRYTHAGPTEAPATSRSLLFVLGDVCKCWLRYGNRNMLKSFNPDHHHVVALARSRTSGKAGTNIRRPDARPALPSRTNGPMSFRGVKGPSPSISRSPSGVWVRAPSTFAPFEEFRGGTSIEPRLTESISGDPGFVACRRDSKEGVAAASAFCGSVPAAGVTVIAAGRSMVTSPLAESASASSSSTSISTSTSAFRSQYARQFGH
jgi:hypothetical protein